MDCKSQGTQGRTALGKAVWKKAVQSTFTTTIRRGFPVSSALSPRSCSTSPGGHNTHSIP
jgi:hypothetical protein